MLVYRQAVTLWIR